MFYKIEEVFLGKRKTVRILIPEEITLSLLVDVTRHLKTISLFSEYLFRYKQEILTKSLTNQEFSFLFESDKWDNSFDFTISKLTTSRLGNCYRNDIKNVIFTFYDIFENEVIFQDCTLTVFFETKLIE